MITYSIKNNGQVLTAQNVRPKKIHFNNYFKEIFIRNNLNNAQLCTQVTKNVHVEVGETVAS